MSQYSEMMGSFVRTGNYPLEANYIFNTKLDLITFFEDPINNTLLHPGLLKIVLKDEDGSLALYWVVEEDGILHFSKLISFNSISELEQSLKELSKKLNQEIEERKLADTAIWGTKDLTEIDLDLNSILKLSDAIIDLRKNIEDLKNITDNLKEDIKAVVGTTEDDIIEYLKTLDYENLTKISETLNYFFNNIDEEKETIDTWIELLNFLKGFTDSDTLLQILTDLWHNILGDPLPTSQFRTLRGIQDFVEELKSYSINRMNNIQSELDQTLIGVGLSGDGAYNADLETYYLKEATSVMNALKILDSLINEAINNCNYLSEDTESVKINIVKEPTKTTIKAWVKVSSEDGNDIVVKNDGIYHNVDSEYENGVLTIKVNGNIRLQHVLGLSSIVEDAKYDPTTETIIIIFKLQNGEKLIVNIPAGALIQEWEVDNSISTKVVEFEKVRVIDGPDKLSADVRISSNKHNILEKDGNTLFVNGVADNIIYDGDVTVKSKLDNLSEYDENLTNLIDDLSEKLDNEILRSTEAEREIQLALKEEIKRSTDRDELLTEQLISETQRAKDAEKVLTDDLAAEINRSVNKDNALEKAISDEVLRAKEAEHSLEDALNNETIRATHAEETLENKITLEISESRKVESELTNKLNSEIERSSNKDLEHDLAIASETNRALLAEQVLQDNIDKESLRATNKETELDNKISNLKDLLDANTDADNNLSNKVTQLTLDLTDESDRAKLAELELLNNINLELERATNKENELDSKISNLKNQLDANTNSDNNLANKVTQLTLNLTEEVNRAQLAEQELQNSIDLEQERATNAETLLDHKIDDVKTTILDEIKRATIAENNLQNLVNILNDNLNDTNTKLTAEIDRSVLKDSELEKLIQNETTRATNSEKAISKEVSDVISKCIVEGATTADEAKIQLMKLGASYSTVEAIGKTLKSFLEDNDFADSTINKWTEIESFLQGITDSETLVELLEQVSNNATVEINKVSQLLKEEIERAKKVESELSKSISDNNKLIKDETERAKSSEALLSELIQSEVYRSVEKDLELENKYNSINTKLTDEINRAKSEEHRLEDLIGNNTTAITHEVERAKEKETLLSETIKTEVADRKAADTEIKTDVNNVSNKLTEEINRAKSAELELLSNIDKETLRATNKENLLDTKIESLTKVVENNKGDVMSKLNDLDEKLNKEITDSATRDSELSNKISDVNQLLSLKIQEANNAITNEVSRATSAENTLNDKLTAEITRSTAAENKLNSDLTNHVKDYNNPHKVTASLINAYTKSETDNLLKDSNNLIDSKLKVISDDLVTLTSDVNTHINDTNNPHNVTKAQVGLGKVDNTTDLEKPISVATQDALNKINIELSKKAEKDAFLNHIYNYNNPHRVTQAQVGLDLVDNTSDLDKPISNATQDALDLKSDIGHTHVMADIEDLENLPIVKGFIDILGELPKNPADGDKYIAKINESTIKYTLLEWRASENRWILKLLTTGGIACVIDGDVYKLNESGLERILDVSDYRYFYDKIYNETKDLIEDIDWEENDATNDTNLKIRLKITYKTKYGDPNESEATNPFKKKSVKYIDIDKTRFLSSAYSRPAIQSDIDNGYATALGEPLLILVMTTGDHVTISLKDSLNIYDPVDTASIDMSVSDWTGTPNTSYKVSGNVRIATTLDKTDAVSLHILNSTEKGLYGTLHTTNTSSITLNPSYGSAGLQKSLTADLNIDSSLNDKSDILLTVGTAGLSAKVIWGEYD